MDSESNRSYAAHPQTIHRSTDDQEIADITKCWWCSAEGKQPIITILNIFSSTFEKIEILIYLEEYQMHDQKHYPFPCVVMTKHSNQILQISVFFLFFFWITRFN